MRYIDQCESWENSRILSSGESCRHRYRIKITFPVKESKPIDISSSNSLFFLNEPYAPCRVSTRSFQSRHKASVCDLLVVKD